jgi:hypothetical protein
MLAGELPTHIAINLLPCFTDGVEYLAWVHSIMRTGKVAISAARHEVCRDRFSAIFTWQKMIELRAFDR